ncbi:RluA family pseudouridine synthase [Geobacter pickeringii]|uniref:Pseudouridine synthase n=1 Tax=Geobacter pickeringii TaxID=345632 RepID=A0A0B5B7V6_9BACT|nr:RluA family pseudouridine synthase [Geobacter pickeringii]AJE02643.1 pseudouridine synthase [Geobacter pickeringii]
MLTFTITETDHCRPVASFLRNLLPAAPLPYLRKLLKSGHLAVNGVPATPDLLLAIDDTVALKESGRTGQFLATEPPLLDILHEDDRIVIVNKPAGLPVHRTAETGDDNLVDLAERFMAERETPVKLRPVNRLDRGTSGATILAKSATSAGMFGRFVKEEGLGKLYLAVAEGTMPPDGEIDAPLDGKESVTRHRLLFQADAEAVVALYPVTGRTHQIRKHLSLIGHPVRGDRRYGGSPLTGYPGHLLHAFRVALRNPETGRELVIHAPLPPGFVAAVRGIAGDAFAPLLRHLPELPPA